MRTVNKLYKFNCNYIDQTKIILNLLNNIVICKKYIKKLQIYSYKTSQALVIKKLQYIKKLTDRIAVT